MSLLFGVHSTLAIVLGVYAAILFFLAFRNPKAGLYGLVPIIGLGFDASSTIKGIYIGVVLAAALLHIVVVKKRFAVSKEMLPFFLILVGFVLWVLLRDIGGNESFSFWVAWVAKRILAPGALALLAIYFLRTEKDILKLVWMLSIFAVATSIVGIGQYFSNESFFWSIRELLGVPEPIAYQIFGRVRISGLSSYVIPLAYQLLSVFPLLLALVLVKTKKGFPRFTRIIAVSILFLCLVLTFVKASIAGAIIGGGAVLLMLIRSRILKLTVPVFLLLAITVTSSFALFDKQVSEKIFSIGDTAYERVPIALAAVKSFSAYPLGIGYSYSEYVKTIYPDISDLEGSRIALVAFPHNIALNVLVVLGFPALILVIIFYFLLGRGLLRASGSQNPLMRVLAVGLLGSFTAYLFNALFHNNSPFFGDAFNWLMLGAAFATINRAALSRRDNLVE